MERREFFAGIAMGTVATLLSSESQAARNRSSPRYLRPPGALPEADFLARCIHCGQCGEICPNRCIDYFGLQNGWGSSDTPYIIPREKSCILCMKCGEICPTDAIAKIPRTAESILKSVKMGQAVVDESLCLSYQGKTCGVCYRACPLPDIAISVGHLEQPHVSNQCVGCGLCERSCIQMPQAIRIIPDRGEDRERT